jgi:cytoskeletal protein CcmA (bactofilin family)
MSPEATVLSEGTRVSGRIAGVDAEIRGEFEGEAVLERAFVVGREGRVRGSVKARSVVVEGSFEGEVHAACLTFSGTARAQGAFWAERIQVSEGAVVDGPFNLPPAAVAAAAVGVDEAGLAGLDLAQEEFASPPLAAYPGSPEAPV